MNYIRRLFFDVNYNLYSINLLRNVPFDKKLINDNVLVAHFELVVVNKEIIAVLICRLEAFESLMIACL